MSKKFSKPELSRKINGDIPFDTPKNQQPEDNSERLDIALINFYPRYTRGELQKFIKLGHVKVNGEVQTVASTPVTEEDELLLEVPENDKEKPPVIYEDDNVIVFNKPAGMLSMKKGAYLPETSIDDFGDIAHRLDRDTSGVIIAAKNSETKGFLQKQFQERHAHKVYYAIVEGEPAQPHAVISVPLTRNLKYPTTFIPDPDGREAITEYEVLDTKNGLSLIKLKPKTGRTHQLRIHMNFIKCPILGDKVYNPKGRKAERMFLHAKSLEITIPGEPNNERKIFDTEVPEEFKKYFENI
jgi:23S rRNA pseudouridine1911/1915/1917 synthase